MLTKFNAAKQREEGFTLIELLIVVIIIGILAAIALPIFIDQSKVAIDASVQSDVRNTVTNVTNAQAQDLGTAKAAVSNADTKVALTAVGRSAAAGSAATTDVATKADSELGNVPALGGIYTVDGYNAGGKKYQGTGDHPAFEFSSVTGRFTQASAASSGSNSGSNGDSPSALPADEDEYYHGSTDNFYFGGASVYKAGQDSQFALAGGAEFDPKGFYNPAGPTAPISGSNFKTLNGIAANDYYDYYDTDVQAVQYYSNTGAAVDIGAHTCELTAASNQNAQTGYTEKGKVEVFFSCIFDGDATSDATLASLRGGSVRITIEGKTSTLAITDNAANFNLG